MDYSELEHIRFMTVPLDHIIFTSSGSSFLTITITPDLNVCLLVDEKYFMYVPIITTSQLKYALKNARDGFY